MDLPLIGTVDLTPSGMFLFFAALVAVGYFVWLIVEARKKAARAVTSEDAPGDELVAGPVQDAVPDGDGPKK